MFEIGSLLVLLGCMAFNLFGHIGIFFAMFN